MKQNRQTEEFEQILLDHTEMCYSVALALTRDSYAARQLTQDVLTWAWQLQDSDKDISGIKMKLLTQLRERFLQQQLKPAFRGRKTPAFADSL